MKTQKNPLDILKDDRGNCYSVMTTLTVRDYQDIVESAYESRGGVAGQRDTLKTSTAIRIRRRMVEDLKAGAVLPPVVLGIVVSDDMFEDLENMGSDSFQEMLNSIPKDNISIIDGMQRTTALSEALNGVGMTDREMRVEYWITTSTNSLIYRMLVLNTGQVPWNLRRQLEVLFRSIVKEIKKKVTSIEVFEVNDQRRRSRAGQFQANQVIELFLVFGARKEKIDTKERLADEFTKQDFIEATADLEFTEMFYEVLRYLGEFDEAFGKYQVDNREGQRFKNGKDLFASQPVCVGFITAIALEVLGRPGMPYTQEEQKSKWNSVKKHFDELLERLEAMSGGEIGQFLDFNTLNELISQKSGRIGDFEREFFLRAFRELIEIIEEGSEFPGMTPCWRAY